MYQPITGIIPPLVTPLTKHNTLDLEGLRNLIEYTIAGGVHALFLLGTTGEGPSLHHSLRKQLITQACSIVDSRVPVMVCITDSSLEEALEIARHAKQAGADILVAAPPFYYPISQLEIQTYFKTLVPLLPLPLILYNMPACTKLHLSLETLELAKDLGVIGLKDSSGDRDYLFSVVAAFKDDPHFSVYTGNETLLPELLNRGGHGVVAGGANFFPKLFVAFYNSCLANNQQAIKRHLKHVNWIGNSIYNIGKDASKYVKGTKSTLSALGICKDYSAMPIQRFNATEMAQLNHYLANFEYDKEYPNL